MLIESVVESLCTELRKKMSDIVEVEVGPSVASVYVPEEYHEFSIYLEIMSQVKRTLQLESHQSLIASVHLPCTETVRSEFNEGSIPKALDPFHPVSFYVCDHKDFLIDAIEEYRKRLIIFESDMVFRSWRTKEEQDLGWEFNNSLFLLGFRDTSSSGAPGVPPSSGTVPGTLY
jgi:uncharacterized protein YozE (UPF0346 family)